MQINKTTLTRLLHFAIGILTAWLIFRYVLGWVAPFLLALFTARIMEPAIRALMARMKLPRAISSSVCSVLILIALGAIAVLVINSAASYLGDFFTNLPDLLNESGQFLDQVRRMIAGYNSSAPPETQNMIEAVIDGFTGIVGEIPEKVSSWALNIASLVASKAPNFFMFFITYAISVFFISISYPDITRFIMRQIPPRWRNRVLSIKEDFVYTLVKWLRAQVMIMGITFLQLAVAFVVLGIPYSILLALVVSLIDALPVFGTGTIIIPWAVISLIGGESTLAIGLAITYGIVSLVRSIIEPRLVGGQFGISPVATLVAMYIGYCTVGVMGMILFPFALMMLKQLNDKDYVNLWK